MYNSTKEAIITIEINLHNLLIAQLNSNHTIVLFMYLIYKPERNYLHI